MVSINSATGADVMVKNESKAVEDEKKAMVDMGVSIERAKEISKELPALFSGAKKTHEVIGRICHHKKLTEAEKIILAFMAGSAEASFYVENAKMNNKNNRNMYG